MLSLFFLQKLLTLLLLLASSSSSSSDSQWKCLPTPLPSICPPIGPSAALGAFALRDRAGGRVAYPNFLGHSTQVGEG